MALVYNSAPAHTGPKGATERTHYARMMVPEPPADEPGAAPLELRLLPGSAELDASGRLSIGGVDVLELVEQVGTPVFIYDEEHLRSRCREAVAAWGDGVAYASKAFLCKAMARLVHEEGMRIDVSTGGELAVALAADVPADRLVLHGNNKSRWELTEALQAGVGRIVVDSDDEITLLASLVAAGLSDDRRPHVMLRVTPGVEAHTHEYVRTGQEDTKFGFSIASGAARAAAARLATIPGVELTGLHCHIGSQVFRTEAYGAAVQALAPLAAELEVTELCVGGGLGVAYVAGEEAPSITQWAALVYAACRSAGVRESVRVSAEPGRAIVAQAAITCYHVGVIKRLPGIRTYVAVDGGMSDNPRPVLYGSGYEAFLPRETDAARPLVARVVGKHCETGDVLVEEAHLPADLAAGDVLATPVTGAYGHSMASTYNRVPRPPVVFVSQGTARVVVRRETAEDMLRLDV